ncbi:MAG: metalloregulator ArsR/SmtB family transcription factor [Bacteroidia bacterium]|nr:metalloregulator ArsR/SmtB family transcription factor [Bacteroidia bacterium]
METIEVLTIRKDKEKLRRIANLMKTIGHPARLAIIDLLLEKGRLPVKEIHESIEISQSNASQHLKALENLDVLRSEREGKNIFYRIHKMPVKTLLECVNHCDEC